VVKSSRVIQMIFLTSLTLCQNYSHPHSSKNINYPPFLFLSLSNHTLIFRWMNKFSPTSTSLRDPNTGKSMNEADFDFGDLVTMTIIDVFETDVNGKLLSYCPTFDNRAVHKTPEMAERIRKGASHLMERVEDVVNSPAGKSVNQVKIAIIVLFEFHQCFASRPQPLVHDG
jgi:hypothetical protein